MKKKSAVAVLFFIAFAVFYFTLGCPFRFLTGISCPGCGMSRAVTSVLTGGFNEAFHFHPLVFVMPVFATLFLFFRKQRRKIYILLAVLCVTLGTVYIYRFVTGMSPDVVYFRLDEGALYKLIGVVLNVSK